MGEQQDGEMKAGSKDIRSKRSKGTSLHLDIMWEWTTIADVLGANSRHLSELYALKQSNHYQSLMGNKAGTFEDIVDAYLAYLQVAVVNPATEKALLRLQWYASDVSSLSEDPTLCSEWAMIQLMDFVQALLNTECASLEIFEDPSAMPLVEVGILYTQRDPSFFRPISQGIKRCLAYPRANAAELLELNQILVAENHSGSLLQAFDAWLQNIEQFHTGKHA
ncbi:hypothetical protein Bca52824_043441 [Brassica carinata]|uniref:Uncharacterized protein n=1 Tax=Brassica carinata TaxID=52824 RepID=A0A8X7RZB0_BRACI|nr:hypothetical protein Bca52824_043441 [Brassica carinata]